MPPGVNSSSLVVSAHQKSDGKYRTTEKSFKEALSIGDLKGAAPFAADAVGYGDCNLNEVHGNELIADCPRVVAKCRVIPLQWMTLHCGVSEDLSGAVLVTVGASGMCER